MENRFVSTIIVAKEITNKMEVEPIFCKKSVIHREKKIDENGDNDKVFNLLKNFLELSILFTWLIKLFRHLKVDLSNLKYVKRFSNLCSISRNLSCWTKIF